MMINERKIILEYMPAWRWVPRTLRRLFQRPRSFAAINRHIKRQTYRELIRSVHLKAKRRSREE